MTAGILFFIFLGILALGFVGVFLNIIFSAVLFEMKKDGLGFLFFLLFILSWAAIIVGKFGALITGIVWIVQTLAALITPTETPPCPIA